MVAAVPGFDVLGALWPADGHLAEALRPDCADHRVGTWEVTGRVRDVGDSSTWENVCFAHTSILSLFGLRYTGLLNSFVVEVPVVTRDTGPDLMLGITPARIAVDVVVTLIVAASSSIAHSHSLAGGLPRH